MKKLVMALMVVALVVGLAMTAAANSYHDVYVWTGTAWEKTENAEMFSKTSYSHQYRWESASGVVPGTPTYAAPTEERPGGVRVQVPIRNFAHVFPWIDYHFTETELIWDIFKPGNYMSLALIIDIRANCPVQVHLGGGSFDVPDYFDTEGVHGQNGHIEKTTITKNLPEELVEPKVRLYSLLDKAAGPWPGSWPPFGSGNETGNGEDVLDTKWFWHLYMGDRPNENLADLSVVPNKDDTAWVSDPNCNSVIIDDTNQLHEGTMGNPISYRAHLAIYEDILVEPCDSEGKYFDQFVITITPDP